MLKKIYDIYLKYKEVILYLVFGGLTTLINIVSYALFTRVCGLDTILSTSLAWIVSVAFAYITNKIYVFESKTDSIGAFFRECISFFGCRLATGIMDIAIMYIAVDELGFPDMIMKIISNILVIVLNFIFSKIFIFKGSEKNL